MLFDAASRARANRNIATMLLGAAGIALLASACKAVVAPNDGPRTVEFSGYTWQVASSEEAVGPGPNHFSDSEDNVWVDTRGRLHLRITHSNGRWYCAEVINTQSLGLGRYSFELGSAVSHFDPNVVLGLLTWSDDPAHANREIDYEFSRWANPDAVMNGQFVVMPHRWNRKRFRQPAVTSSTQSFDWSRTAVRFTSSSAVPSTWTSSAGVPPPGSEHARINFWLYLGAPPQNGRAAEVIVNSFEFTRTLRP